MQQTIKLFKEHNDAIYKKHIPTSFATLDKILNGGLTTGVHYIGAVSSLGKSTFCIQMAYNMAKQKYNVLYFSLEMFKVDIVAKLISYETANIADFEGTFEYAKTSNDLLSKTAIETMTEEETKVVQDAMDEVEENVKTLTVVESVGTLIDINQIESIIDKYTEKHSNTVVFIDYLQALSAPKTLENATDKKCIDYAVAKLRSIAAKYQTPIVVISSFSRAGYDTPVSMQDFKESGNIEYTADTLIGLQFKGVGDSHFNINEAKSAEPRDIELVVLKQRYGEAGIKIHYRFSASYNQFKEIGIIKDTPPIKISRHL